MWPYIYGGVGGGFAYMVGGWPYHILGGCVCGLTYIGVYACDFAYIVGVALCILHCSAINKALLWYMGGMVSCHILTPCEHAACSQVVLYIVPHVTKLPSGPQSDASSHAMSYQTTLLP